MIDPHILIPGWAGGLEIDELGYVLRHLRANPNLKRLWGFRGKGLTTAGILRVAEWGKPRDTKHNAALATLNPAARGANVSSQAVYDAIIPGLVDPNDFQKFTWDWEATKETKAAFWASLRNAQKPPSVDIQLDQKTGDSLLTHPLGHPGVVTPTTRYE